MNTSIIQVKTSDNLLLPGILYKGENSKKVAIYLHGNGSSNIFFNQTLYSEYASALAKKNISLFVLCNRGGGLINKIRISEANLNESYNAGSAYEIIKDCVLDIEGSIDSLEGLGFDEFHLIGHSTGANKICVYDHYKKDNRVSKYVLLSGGDDTGIYYDLLGKDKFNDLLSISKSKIEAGKGMELMKELFPDTIFSYQSFFDVCNPDGDYNTFPFYEKLNSVKLSTSSLFRYFESLKKESIVIYGEFDEYAWGNVPKVMDVLKEYKPDFKYCVISGGDHNFTGLKTVLAENISEFLG